MGPRGRGNFRNRFNSRNTPSKTSYTTNKFLKSRDLKKPKKSKTCELCSNNQPSNYKDPKSGIFYCSVACFKKITSEMRENRMKELENKRKNFPNQKDLNSNPNNNFTQRPLLSFIPESDQIPEKLFNFLTEDVALRNLLKNKRLQDILNYIMTIRKIDYRREVIGAALKNEPVFREYCDACLKVIEPDLLDDRSNS